MPVATTTVLDMDLEGWEVAQRDSYVDLRSIKK